MVGAFNDDPFNVLCLLPMGRLWELGFKVTNFDNLFLCRPSSEMCQTLRWSWSIYKITFVKGNQVMVYAICWQFCKMSCGYIHVKAEKSGTFSGGKSRFQSCLFYHRKRFDMFQLCVLNYQHIKAVTYCYVNMSMALPSAVGDDLAYYW